MHSRNTASSEDIHCLSCDVPPEVIDITQELFPGPIDAWLESDPETPSTAFVLLMVRADGDPKEIVDRRLEWHRRVADSLPHAEFRLCITSI